MIYNLKELAREIDMTPQTAYYHIKNGDIKATKLKRGLYDVKRKCTECIYHEEIQGLGIPSYRGCWYINITGESRECSPLCCNKFKRRSKK